MLPKALFVGGVLLFAVLGSVAMFLYMSPEPTSSLSFLNLTIPSVLVAPQTVSHTIQVVPQNVLFKYKTAIIGVGVAAAVLLVVVVAVTYTVHHSNPALSKKTTEDVDTIEEPVLFDSIWGFVAICSTAVIIIGFVSAVVWRVYRKHENKMEINYGPPDFEVDGFFDLERLKKCKSTKDVIKYQLQFIKSQPQGWSYSATHDSTHPHKAMICVYDEDGKPMEILTYYTSHEPNRAVATVILGKHKPELKGRFGFESQVKAKTTSSDEPTCKIFYMKPLVKGFFSSDNKKYYLPSAFLQESRPYGLDDEIIEPYMVDIYVESFKFYRSILANTKFNFDTLDALKKVWVYDDKYEFEKISAKRKLTCIEHVYVCEEEDMHPALLCLILYRNRNCKWFPHLKLTCTEYYIGVHDIDSQDKANEYLDKLSLMIADPMENAKLAVQDWSHLV